MSCIITFKKDGKMVLASDKNISNDSFSAKLIEPKIFKREDMWLGVVGSCTQLFGLKYQWDPPQQENGDSNEIYVYKHVLPSMNSFFKDNSIEGENLNAFFLIKGGELYQYQIDNSMIRTVNTVAAIGSTGEYAEGVIDTVLQLKPDWDIESTLTFIFNQINHHCAIISKEFDFEII